MSSSASTCSAEMAATTSTPCSGAWAGSLPPVAGSRNEKIFSSRMKGRKRKGNSAGSSPRRSLANIFSSVPCAKQTSGTRDRPAATRRRLTSRSTTVFMNAWCAMNSVNVVPVRASISSVHVATSSVSRCRYAATSSALMLCQR